MARFRDWPSSRRNLVITVLGLVVVIFVIFWVLPRVTAPNAPVLQSKAAAPPALPAPAVSAKSQPAPEQTRHIFPAPEAGAAQAPAAAPAPAQVQPLVLTQVQLNNLLSQNSELIANWKEADKSRVALAERNGRLEEQVKNLTASNRALRVRVPKPRPAPARGNIVYPVASSIEYICPCPPVR